jgi:hypothetical protein
MAAKRHYPKKSSGHRDIRDVKRRAIAAKKSDKVDVRDFQSTILDVRTEHGAIRVKI